MPSRPVVLVVDDDPDVREVLAAVLENEGMVAIEAATGGEALRILEDDSTIGLLLTDVLMPGISGIALAERAVQVRPDLKIVFISAYAPPNAVQGVMLRKPFRLDQLRATLRAVMAEN